MLLQGLEMLQKNKHIIVPVLKFAFAFTIIFFMLRSGKLDLSLLGKSMKHGKEWSICILIMMTNVFISSLRWHKILKIEGKVNLSAIFMLKTTWIGSLFSSILPGIVSGDFIKLLYIKKKDPSFSKTFLILSVLIDRIFGLMALLFIMGLASLINYQELTAISDEVESLIHFNFLLFLGMLCFLGTIFFPSNWQRKLITFVSSLPLLSNILVKTLENFWLIGKHKKVVFQSLGYGLIIQILNIGAFWTIASPFFKMAPNMPIGHTIDLLTSYSFIPIGLISIAIPITPAGIGIGHVIFDKLFSFFSVTNGASLFNFYFISTVLVSLMGIIPYLLSGTKINHQQLEQDFGTAS